MSTKNLSNKVFAQTSVSHLAYDVGPFGHSKDSTYHGFPLRGSSFVSTFKQNQRICFTREWFYEEMSVVPMTDWSLGVNSSQRQCLLRSLTHAQSPCPVCANVARYRDRINAPKPSWAIANNSIAKTRPQTSFRKSHKEMKKCNHNSTSLLRAKDFDDLIRCVCISVTSTKDHTDDDIVAVNDKSQDSQGEVKNVDHSCGGDLGSSYTDARGNTEEPKDNPENLEILIERLEYARKTNQVLRYYTEEEEDIIATPSFKFNIKLPSRNTFVTKPNTCKKPSSTTQG